MTYSFAPNNAPLYVREGDYVQFKFKAPSQWNTTLTVTIQIGDLVQFWSIITIPEDFTPDPFPLESVEDAEFETMYFYADGSRPSESIIVVSGLTDTTEAGCEVTSNIGVPPGEPHVNYYGMRIDYDGNGTWDTGTAATNYYITTDSGVTPTVRNNARIQLKGRTKTFENQKTRVTLRIGTSFSNWDITTKPIPLNKPEPFPEFEDLIDQPLNTYVYTDEVIQVTGLFEPGDVIVSSGEFAVSNTATTATNGDGYDVLTGVTWASTGTISNGQYIQLRTLTSNVGNTPTNVNLSIAFGDGSIWSVTTGAFPSTNPVYFDFDPKTNINLNTLTASDTKPVGGISGLGDGITVPVEIVSTDSDLVRIKISDGSIGVFPTTVTNGDTITLYVTSADTVLTTRNLSIKVGDRTIPPFQVQTFSGPDSIPSAITPPPDRNGVIPGTYITSAPVTIEGINVPVTITSTNVNSLISIDFDTAESGPRTFDPAINSSFRIVQLSATTFPTTESTTVTVGNTGAANNPFVWNVTTYTSVPPAATNLGVWYSKKNEKEEGYTIGTILPILKESSIVGYGNLTDGGLSDRYPGFVECDGTPMDANLYPELYEIIGTTYGGSVTESNTAQVVTQTRNGITYTSSLNTITYSGNFNLPDYRNRRMCGTGIVDSARGNSAFLTPSNNKTIVEPGAEGGYWYFDRVDPFGPEPLEQIQGTGTTGLDSDFYSLGTIRITGTDSITDNIGFAISGQVSGTIGELQEIVVSTPEHDHPYFAALPESESGFPLIAWGNTANGRGMFRTNAGGTSGNDDSNFNDLTIDPVDDAGQADDDPSLNDQIFREAWAEILEKSPFKSAPSLDGTIGNKQFEQALEAYYGSAWEGMDQFIFDNFKVNMTGGDTAGGGDEIDGFDDQDVQTFEIEFYTWWISDYSQLGSANLLGGAVSEPLWACVFDISPGTFTIDNFLAAGGTTLGHNHLMTLDPVTNFQTDFTGGNFNKAGQGGAYGSGLGNGSTTQTVTFTQSDVFMEMTEGTFEFSRAFASPVPDVTMRPQSQAPIMVPFYKTKYIIKAY